MSRQALLISTDPLSLSAPLCLDIDTAASSSSTASSLDRTSHHLASQYRHKVKSESPNSPSPPTGPRQTCTFQLSPNPPSCSPPSAHPYYGHPYGQTYPPYRQTHQAYINSGSTMFPNLMSGHYSANNHHHHSHHQDLAAYHHPLSSMYRAQYGSSPEHPNDMSEQQSQPAQHHHPHPPQQQTPPSSNPISVWSNSNNANNTGKQPHRWKITDDCQRK